MELALPHRRLRAGGSALANHRRQTRLLDEDQRGGEAEAIPLIEIPVNNNYLKLLFKGFFLNFINIGVLGFWLGLIVVIGPTLDMNPTHIFWYFTTILISYFVTDLGKIFLAKKLKSKLTPLVIYKIKKTMGILLIIFGVFLLLKGFIPKEKLNLDEFIDKM